MLFAKKMRQSFFFLSFFCLAACGGGGGGGGGGGDDPPPPETVTSIYNFSYKTDHGLFSPPHKAIVSGERLYFLADDGDHGEELWATRGTDGTTALVLDATAGPDDSYIEEITPTAEGLLFFTANSGVRNRLFYCSHDGSTKVSLTPGAAGHQLASVGKACVLFSGKYTFSFSATGDNLQPWITDLTAQNTQPIIEATLTGRSNRGNFTVFDGRLFFTAIPDGQTDTCLYVSLDGTPEKTQPLAIMPDGLEDIDNLVVVDNTLLFSATDDTHGYELWCLRADGQGGLSNPTLLGETNPGPGNSLDVADGGLVCMPAADGLIYESMNEDQKTELWRTNGIETSRLITAATGLNDITALHPWHDDRFFIVTLEPDMKRSLWLCGGTEATTARLHTKSNSRFVLALGKEQAFFVGGDLNRCVYRCLKSTSQADLVIDLAVENHAEPMNLLVYGNRLFFKTYNAFDACEWISDGSASGTRIMNNSEDAFLKSIYRAARNPIGGQDTAGEVLMYDNQVAACHDDEKHGYELWLGNGTLAGSRMVKDINTYLFCPSFTAPVVWSDHLHFAMQGDETGRQMWRSDGTQKGTSAATMLGHPQRNPLVCDPATAGNALYFFAENHTHGKELWRMSATSPEPERLTDICPGQGDGILGWEGLHYSASHQLLYFSGQDGQNPGIYTFGSGGLNRIKQNDILISYFKPLSTNGGIFFFLADKDTKLWRTTGDPAQTRAIADTCIPSGNALVAMGKVFFLHKGETTQSLRVYDPETDRVEILRDGFHLLDRALDMRVYHGVVVLLLDPLEAPGLQIWQTAGTPETTVKTEDLPSNKAKAFCGGNPIVFRDRLWFLTHDEKNIQLWCSGTTGSPGNSSIVKQIGPYSQQSVNACFSGIAGDRLFLVYTAANGQPDLWICNGTADSTRKVMTLFRGNLVNPLFPLHTITDYDGSVYFLAFDRDKGLELMALEL